MRIVSVGNERFPLPLPQPLQIIPQLILNRAGAEFVESFRGVIFYRASSITYIKLYMLLCLYGLPLRMHNCAYAAWASDALRQQNR